MFLLGYLLVPIVLTVGNEFKNDNYIVTIEENTLTSVLATNGSSNELNLSGFGFEHVDKDAFKNLSNLTMLNLANNSIVDLSAFVFSNLTNLEYLSLADNNLKRLKNVFRGLDNLKSLNISNNLMKTIEPSEFYGLSKSVDISIKGNPLRKICSLLFKNKWKRIPRYRKRRDVEQEINTEQPKFRAQICIHEGIVKQLTDLEENERIPNDCMEIKMSVQPGDINFPGYIKLNLSELGIVNFERGWYRMATRANYQTHIDLSNNEIVRIEAELMNDLPSSVDEIDLSGNMIERLESGKINNSYTEGLRLNNNRIRDIEAGALQTMPLTDLWLNNNELKDTKFMSTLSSGLVRLELKNNTITELSDNATSGLERLLFFYLNENHINAVRRDSLRGLKNVQLLELSDNRIETLEPGSFQDLVELQFLFLNNNSIASLDSGVFDGPKEVSLIDMSFNRLKELKKNVVPRYTSAFYLDYNEIENLESVRFTNVPINMFSLEGNKISEIPKGTFQSSDPELVDEVTASRLILLLTRWNRISLFDRHIQEKRAISKWAHSEVIAFSKVDLSSNPIRRLVNGSLFGILQNPFSWIDVSNCPIELIQGGLFDNV